MNIQEGMQVNGPTPSPTPISSAGTNVQRLMPVLYVGQSNVRSVSPSSQPPNPGASVTSGPTILTAMPQIQLAGGGNPQLIHSSSNSNTFTHTHTHYIPVRQVYQQGKAMKDTPKKVYVTSINSGPNNKSNQVNLILPNNQNPNTGNKSPITSLILPQIGTMSGKSPITGMILPNNSPSGNSNKPMASLLLPANTKYPTIAPNKKVPIPNIIIPQQNMNKQTSVPNIIRQTNNPTNKNVAVGIFSSQTNSNSPQMTSLLLTPNNNANKQPPTSVGLILPTSSASHGIIMSQSTTGQTHGIIVPQSSGGIIVSQSTAGQTHNIMVPQSSSSVTQALVSQPSTQMANLIISSNAATPQASNTPITSLLISNTSSVGNTVGSSLLISQNPAAVPTSINSSAKSSIIVPVSVGPNKASVLQPVTYAGGKKSLDPKLTARENKQSLLVKAAGDNSLPSLPPLQPITTKSILVKPPNGVTVPDSLIVTPINENEPPKKQEKISDEMTIERTSSMEEKSTGTGMSIQRIEERSWSEEEKRKSEVSMTVTPLPSRRASNKEDEGQDYDITVSCLRPDTETEKRKAEKKQVEDEVKIEVLKPERQKLPPPRYQKPEDLNPMEVLEWDHQGVGKLPGSNIKFRINEFGLDLVVDSNKDESSSNTPVSSRRNSDEKPSNSDKKNTSESLGEGVDKIYCCEGCGCYGLYTEFLMDTRFCSVACKKFVLSKNEQKKKRREDKLKELQLRRKRRKIKILAQRARRGSIEQKTKDSGDKNDTEEASGKFWRMKVAELRKKRKSNVTEESEASRPEPSVASETEESETVSPSPAQSEDDGSEKTPNLDASWTNSSGEFMWSTYLQKCCNKSKAAPIKLFKDPFPYGKNGFKVGMKLEGIDPEHQAIISVLTVNQVRGHRIRLHFDGYPECHDFWTNSYSPDIFPPGWCERNQHTLHPPRGYTMENFSWNTYLKQCRAQPAPKSLFPRSNAPLCPSQFRVGMKLEAVDRKNSSLICVASVANLIDNRLLIHFDSWGDVYDYWTDPSSPYIHPVGWCEENGHDLTPPNNYKNPSTFSWEQYLKETKAVAAPARAFKPRPPNAFKRGMKLEAIDKRAPSNLRPSTVKEVKDYQIKIVFDGYPDEFGYWVDDDCPDIHPVGWGHKTGHPIKPPPLASEVKSECGTKGCIGDGSIKGGFLTRHATAALCPYSPQNLNGDNVRDRFCVNPDFYEVPEPINNKTKANSIKQDTEDSSSEPRVKTRLSSSSLTLKEDPVEKMEVEGKTEERVERRGRKRKQPEPESVSEQLDRLRKELVQTVLDPGYKPSPDEQEMWVKHVATLGHKVNATGGDPRAWNHKQVAAFVNTVIPSRAKLFLDQEVDGESFLMMTQTDLTKVLGLRLGPALKIYNCIILLRQKVSSL